MSDGDMKSTPEPGTCSAQRLAAQATLQMMNSCFRTEWTSDSIELLRLMCDEAGPEFCQDIINRAKIPF